MKTTKGKLACWICTILAAFFCFSFMPRDALAGDFAGSISVPSIPAEEATKTADESLEALEQKIDELVRQEASLKAAIAEVEAKIAALADKDSLIVVSEVQASNASAVLVEQYRLGMGAPASLWKLRANQGGTYRAQHKWGEFKEFVCAHSGITKENCNDAYLSTLKKGTIVSIPASEVLVQVPAGAPVPEALALTPIPGDKGLLRVESPAVTVVTEAQKMAETAAALNAEALADAHEIQENLALALALALILTLGSLVAVFSLRSDFIYSADRVIVLEKELRDVTAKLAAATGTVVHNSVDPAIRGSLAQNIDPNKTVVSMTSEGNVCCGSNEHGHPSHDGQYK